MLVRYAQAADAEQAASVLRRSITTLCVLDHGGAEAAIGPWISNKTADNFRHWAEATDRCVIVAEENDVILGVGASSFAGEIALNYVAPEARFKGVSKAIMAFLEDVLRTRGQAQCALTSTRTAHRFYMAAGYSDSGEPNADGSQPMTKLLQISGPR